MKTLFFILALSLFTSTSYAIFGLGAPIEKKVCNSVASKNSSIAIECDNFVKGKKFDEDYAEWCLKIGELANKVATADASDPLNCMNNIFGKKLSDLPKKQIKFCEKIVGSNKSKSVLDCISYQHPSVLFEICEKTLQMEGTFANAGDCLAAITKFKVTNFTEIEAAKECFSKSKGVTMKVNSWDEIISCMNNAAPAQTSVPNGSRSGGATK